MAIKEKPRQKPQQQEPIVATVQTIKYVRDQANNMPMREPVHQLIEGLK